MQPFDQGQSFVVERPDVVDLRLAFGGFDRFHYGFHVQRPFLRFIVFATSR